MHTSTLIAAAAGLAAVASVGVMWSSQRTAQAAEVEMESKLTELQGDLSDFRAELAEIRRLLAEQRDPSRALSPQIDRGPRVPLAETESVVEPQAATETPAFDLVNQFASMTGELREDSIEDLVDLARNGDQRALELILSCLADEDADIREEAIEAIGELADPALIPSLEAHMDDASGRVREEVAEALRNMPANEAGPLLTRLLDDASSDVVEESLRALRSLDYQDAIPRITDMAFGSDLDAAALAARTLGRMGRTDLMDQTLDRLAPGLDDPDPLERINAVRRMRRIGGDRAIEYLEQILRDDQNVSVRLEAQRALERLRD